MVRYTEKAPPMIAKACLRFDSLVAPGLTLMSGTALRSEDSSCTELAANAPSQCGLCTAGSYKERDQNRNY